MKILNDSNGSFRALKQAKKLPNILRSCKVLKVYFLRKKGGVRLSEKKN